MSLIWAKLIAGIVFVLVPGFTLKENYRKHPYLTVVSLLLGFFLLFLSLKPLVEAVDPERKSAAEIKLEKIQKNIKKLEEDAEARSTLEKQKEEVRLANLKKQEDETKRLIELQKETDRLKKEKLTQRAKDKAEKEKLTQIARDKAEKERLDIEKTKMEQLTKELVEQKKLAKAVAEKENQINSSYLDNNDGTITDLKNNLIWKKCSEGLSGINCEHGSPKKLTATEAKQTASLSNNNKWKVPTIQQLRTLVYCSNGLPQNKAWDIIQTCAGSYNSGKNYSKPTIIQKFFPNTKSAEYWSNSFVNNTVNGGYYINFNYGTHDVAPRVNKFYVRLVKEK